MTDVNQPQDAAPVQPSQADGSAASDPQDISSLPDWARELITRTRKEAAGYRTAARQREEEARHAEEARLAAQNEWQQLAEKRAAELEALKPLKTRIEQIEQATRESNERRIAAIPESLRSLVPTGYDPLQLRDWLDANSSTLSAPRPPQTDAGTRGDSGPAVPKLSDAEMEAARKLRVTPEQYAKYRTSK